MQLMIDVLAESPAALRLAAEFLNSHAALREAMEEATPNVPTGTQPAAPFVPAAATPAVAAPSVPAAPGNVVPFVPPVPTTSAPSAATPVTSAPPAAPSSNANVPPAASAAPSAPDEFDDHGVPYDARIHQSGKGKKKDGSWKLRKGIDDAIVSVVMQELAPRIRKAPAAPTAPAAPAEPNPADVFGHTPLPAGASPAPVSLPPVPPPPGVPAPPAPEAQAQTGVPPVPPGAETVAPPADPFRAIVAKITKARGEKRLTAEEVTQCCASAGVPTLQSLNAMPHLIATVEANIDALLATR